MHELKLRIIQNVVIMGGLYRLCNNLFNKTSKPLKSTVVVSDELHYLIIALKFNGLSFGIMELIIRKGKYATVSRVNDCYKDIARGLRVPYFSHQRKTSESTLICPEQGS